MLPQASPSGTPSTARRRSPRNHASTFESPFTATLNQLMSEANNNTSPSRGLHMDFGDLPDLPHLSDHSGHHSSDLNFHDFFSADVPMPSSPPGMFRLYEDPMTMQNIDWNEFNEFTTTHAEDQKKQVMIKTEPDLEEEKVRKQRK